MISDSIKRPKLIIFDWDNTLADTTEVVTKVINRLRADFNQDPMTSGDVLRYTGDPERDWIIDLFGKKCDEMSKKYQLYYAEENLSFIPTLLFGARKIIDTLSSMSIQSAILTNKYRDITIKEIEYLSLTDTFISVFTKDDLPVKKPDPIGITMIVDKWKLSNPEEEISKDEIWFIGDTMTDMATAKNYGCQAFFVGDTSWITEKYADYILNIGNLNELSKFLENF